MYIDMLLTVVATLPQNEKIKSFTSNVTIHPGIGIDASAAAGGGQTDTPRSAVSTPGKPGVAAPSQAAEDSAELSSRLRRRKSRRDRKSRDVSAMLHRLSGVRVRALLAPSAFAFEAVSRAFIGPMPAPCTRRVTCALVLTI